MNGKVFIGFELEPLDALRLQRLAADRFMELCAHFTKDPTANFNEELWGERESMFRAAITIAKAMDEQGWGSDDLMPPLEKPEIFHLVINGWHLANEVADALEEYAGWLDFNGEAISSEGVCDLVDALRGQIETRHPEARSES